MGAVHGLTTSEIGRLEECHGALLVLCLELEELAAELESGLVPAAVGIVADKVEPLVAEAHRLEEEAFYPSLEARAASCFGSLMIAQIKSEHRVDRRAAHELALTLRAVGNHRCALGLDTVAHMTSSFQEYLRRHVTAEQMLLANLLATESEDATEPVA
jgi:hemerythrin-like domain-containing protein